MAIAEEDWARAVELLSGVSEVALACHVDPDGDALGSMLALQRQLAGRGVKTSASYGAALNREEPFTIPPQYTFLPGLSDLTPPRDFPAVPEVLIAFDCASVERLGSLRPNAEAAGTVLVLDHHASGRAFGDIRLVDAEAPATAVVVAELLDRLGLELDRETATCLYVGLVTDTGRFSYSSTRPETMELGARLIRFGIDHGGINRRVWETHSFGYLKVLARALDRAVLVPEAGLAWTVVHQHDLDDLGISLAETEGLIDHLRTVEVADIALVLKEQADGTWKATMRSKGGVDVGAIAERMGGGGHAFSAGFTTSESLEDLVDGVVYLLAEHEDVPASRPSNGSKQGAA